VMHLGSPYPDALARGNRTLRYYCGFAVLDAMGPFVAKGLAAVVSTLCDIVA
jgi:hypothetical protein